MWAGVDVGGRRKGFHTAVVDAGGLVAGPIRVAAVEEVEGWLRRFRPKVVAVDSPRSPAPDGSRSRECERDLRRAVCGIRYTPSEALLADNPYYAWILNGLELYAVLTRTGSTVIECFPTASFTRWAGVRGRETRARWSRSSLEAFGFPLVPHGQDGRDALAAALTAQCFDEGSFEAFGDIVVPSLS
jgi:predicted nuclease with RNAse H fold